MFISDFAIRRPVITVVTMLALSVFGIFALFNLDTDEFPGCPGADRRRRHPISGRIARERRARDSRTD